jgi:hypothetical protein
MTQCRKILKYNALETQPEKSTREFMMELTGIDILQCPFYKKGSLREILKIEKNTGPGFFEQFNLTAIPNTS